MKNLRNILLVNVLILILVPARGQVNVPVFEEDENVVFVGNSITHGGHYHSYIWLYYMTHYPDRSIRITNCGIGGDCSWDILERLETDILDRNPSYLTLTFGMNDVGYYDFFKKNADELAQEKISRSINACQEIEKQLLEQDIQSIVLIGSSPYDEDSRIERDIFPGKNDAIKEIIDFQKKSAMQNQWGFVDFNEPMILINRENLKKDSLFAISGPDRIHPDNDGHMVMAYLFLKAQGLQGKNVSEVIIDSESGVIEKNENCTVSGLQCNKTWLVYDYLAHSLPYPLDTVARGWGSKKSQADGCKLVPFEEEFNQEIVQIRNLRKGSYKMLIDDKYIDDFTAGELEAGVNLADYPETPQYQQSREIMMLNEERFETERKLRDYAWMKYSFFQNKGLESAEGDQAIDTLKKYIVKDIFVRGNYDVYSKARYPEMRSIWNNLMDQYVQTIYRINKPVMHTIKIVRI
jgi:lysophospholipase L1-like esterase